MQKKYIQSAKTELERLQKQSNTAANRSAPKQRAEQGKKSRDTPLSGKEKGDTVLPMPPVCIVIFLNVQQFHRGLSNILLPDIFPDKLMYVFLYGHLHL